VEKSDAAQGLDLPLQSGAWVFEVETFTNASESGSQFESSLLHHPAK